LIALGRLYQKPIDTAFGGSEGQPSSNCGSFLRQYQCDSYPIEYLYKILCPDAPIKVISERILEIKKDPNQFLFVYEKDGIVLGTVMLVICLSAMFGVQPFGLIEHFIVDEKARRQGIQGALDRPKKLKQILILVVF
jgi:hypothetical protein